MSRNKENNKPLPRKPRAVGSVFIGKQPTPPSAEFFTDSLIEDTSRIPSPSPLKNKNALNYPRRALGQFKPLAFAKDSPDAVRRSNTPQDVEKDGIRHQQPAPTLQRPLSMRSSQSDLITPPQSRDGPTAITSPISEVSNPPQDLTDTYQRIYDEELLATTERDDFSSENDDDQVMDQHDKKSPNKPFRRSASRDVLTEQRRPRSVTPDTVPIDANKENVRDEHTGAFSEGSGMSFLNQLTDRNLAAKATPLISNHVRDMKRLQQGISTRPISFNAAPKPSEFIADDARSNPSSDRSSQSSRRMAQRYQSPVANGAQRAYSDTVSDGRPNSNPAKPVDEIAPSHSPRQPLRELQPLVTQREKRNSPTSQTLDDDSDETSPELLERERQFELNRARKLFGIAPSTYVANGVHIDTAPATQNQSLQTEDPLQHDEDTQDVTQRSVRSRSSEETAPSLKASTNIPITNKGILRKWQRTAAEQRADKIHDAASEVSSSAVDWLGVDADAPLPSVEGSADEEIDVVSDVLSPKPNPGMSPDRFPKIDGETTRMSFQVSESPPVKQRKSIDDLAREREIDQLSRQAVTKSRLEAIRERDPFEAHRRLSRSPNGSSLKKSISNSTATREDVIPAGEPIPDTPVVVFRSSSSSSKDTSRSDHDRRASHDALQRFARLSATPKSSPSIPLKLEPSSGEQRPSQHVNATEKTEQRRMTVATTPRISGAWTDTVLPPDTIGTVGQVKAQPKYAQTPHVSAGGWVDTPLPQNIQRTAMPDSVNEATEDLTTDVAAEVAADQQQLREGGIIESRPQIGHSALTNILNAQRTRDPGDNDTLNLGETTIASLEDLVDLNEEDVTTLIRMGAEYDALRQFHNGDLDGKSSRDPRGASGDTPSLEGSEAEIVVLDRLARKLQTLQANIRHARKAANRFEREMSEGTVGSSDAAEHEGAHAARSLDQSGNIVPEMIQAGSSGSVILNRTGLFPLVLTPLHIPLPLLFHRSDTTTSKSPSSGHRLRHKASHTRRFRKPTPILYVLLALLFYRLLETFLSEIYAHPLYAESYSWPDVVSVAASSSWSHADDVGRVRPMREPEPGYVIPSLVARSLWGGHAEGMKQFADNAKKGLGDLMLSGISWFDAGEKRDDPHSRVPQDRAEEKGGNGDTYAQGSGDEDWSMLDDEVL